MSSVFRLWSLDLSRDSTIQMSLLCAVLVNVPIC